MAGAQVHSQSDHDDDDDHDHDDDHDDGSRGLFDYRYSELPVSERERSDTSVSQKQGSSDGHHSGSVADGIDHHMSNTEQPGGSKQPVEQSSQSSETLPGRTNTKNEGDAVGQSAAITNSEDNRLLQSSSA